MFLHQNSIKIVAIFYLLFVNHSVQSALHQRKLVCYFTNWSQYRPGLGRYSTNYVDATLCTHIIFAFAQLHNGVLAPIEWNDEDLKVLIAVGGWNARPNKFSDMVHDDEMRKTFVHSSVKFLKQYHFDGLDLDWEYPGVYDGSRASDKIYFSILIKELHETFKKNGLLLSAAVGVSKSTIERAYEIPVLSKYLDFINLMTYDYHGLWESFTGFNAPLYKRDDEIGVQAMLNVNWTVQYWLDNGADHNKLILGFGLYGRTFTLKDSRHNKPGDAAIGPATSGRFTNESGFFSYYEICDKLSNGWTDKWQNEQLVPYAYSEEEWVGYDNPNSINAKVNFIKTAKLGGAMVWSLDLDDFKGNFCKRGIRYPLIKTIKKTLNTNHLTKIPNNPDGNRATCIHTSSNSLVAIVTLFYLFIVK